MILRLLSCLKIILICQKMNIINRKAYLRNSYYQYELSRNLAGRNKSEVFIRGFYIIVHRVHLTVH